MSNVKTGLFLYRHYIIAVTISLPEEELTQLHDLLAAWPAGRRVAVESELRTLIGKLLHMCGVVRPGKYFVRRMLLAVGLPQLNSGQVEYGASGGSPRRRVDLTAEFHADIAFWTLIVNRALRSSGGTLGASLHSFYLQPHSHTLVSDASGTAIWAGAAWSRADGGGWIGRMMCKNA